MTSGPTGYDPVPQSFDPYGSPQPERPRKQKSSWGCWILAIVLGTGGLLLVVCCGGGFFLMRFGLNMVTAEIEDQLRGNARLREHVGDVQSLEMDWARSFADNEQDRFIYRVKGTKGEGLVTVVHVTNDDDKEEIRSARLQLPSGETIDLLPE